MYRLPTINFVIASQTDRQTDRQRDSRQYHANSRSYCTQQCYWL